eukprot:3061679-Rhodomonas_salina.1
MKHRVSVSGLSGASATSPVALSLRSADTDVSDRVCWEGREGLGEWDEKKGALVFDVCDGQVLDGVQGVV